MWHSSGIKSSSRDDDARGIMESRSAPTLQTMGTTILGCYAIYIIYPRCTSLSKPILDLEPQYSRQQVNIKGARRFATSPPGHNQTWMQYRDVEPPSPRCQSALLADVPLRSLNKSVLSACQHETSLPLHRGSCRAAGLPCCANVWNFTLRCFDI